MTEAPRHRLRGIAFSTIAAMAAVAGLAACSRTTPSMPVELPAAQVSGGRLHARMLAGPDGLRIPLGWVDTQLGTPCRIQTAQDNALRCLSDPVLHNQNGVQFYSNATCTAPAVDAPAFCAGAYGDPPAFIVDDTLAPSRYLPVTGALAAGTQAYILKPDCILSQAFSHGYAVGAPVPLAAFALASANPPTGAPRLQPLYRTAEDTAQELIGIRDTARGETCTPQTAADGKLRCLPDGGLQGGVYADPACTRIAVPPPGAFALPSTAYTVVTTAGGCSARHIYALQDTTTTGTRYEQQDGACTAIPGDPTAFTAGDEIPSSDFVALTTRDVGTGRIRERVVLDDTGRAVARGYAWIDTHLNAAVYPESIDGRSYALVPQGTGLPNPSFYFSDAACTQQQELVEVPADPCAPPVAAGYTVAPGMSTADCAPPEVRTLGAAVDRGRIYSLISGSCAPLTGAQPELRPAGAPVALSTFVTATVTSE